MWHQQSTNKQIKEQTAFVHILGTINIVHSVARLGVEPRLPEYIPGALPTELPSLGEIPESYCKVSAPSLIYTFLGFARHQRKAYRLVHPPPAEAIHRIPRRYIRREGDTTLVQPFE